MRYHKKFGLFLLLALLLGLGTEAQAQTGNCTPAIGENSLDINNVRARILNNGNLFWRGSPHVYEVPKGGGANAIFTSGVWIGGTVGGQLRVAAARYGNYNFWAGPLDDAGNPPSDCSIYDRVFKVSRSDVEEYEATGSAIQDLRQWPTGLGAPTLDADGNEIDVLSTPFAQRKDRLINLAGGERPAILGDQSLWAIFNDRGNEHLASSSDTPPIGLEVHMTAFAFNTSGDIGNTTFYRYNMYYKGAEPLENAYIGIFSDPDLGNFDDDWVGADTSLGMGYVYNADNDDEGGEGYGSPAPAAGYDFFQGPVVPATAADSAITNGQWTTGFKNLKMTHFIYYNNGGGVTEDPGNGADYYNYLSGNWKDGQQITFGGNGRDFSDTPTDFMYPGDPVTCSYWSECNTDNQGTAQAPADRRFAMSSGPFTINPGDFQQIVYGIVWARGADNFDSVAKMRDADQLAQAAFDINFELPSPPAAPEVTATAMDGQVILEWTNAPRSNNYLESYNAEDPFAPEGNNRYAFEAYEVYQYDNQLDQIGKRIATYDVQNGVTRVVDGIPGEPTVVTALGADNGVQRHHVVGGLTNYKTYYFGVQAYAYNDASTPKVYRGPLKRLEVIPTRVASLEGGTLLSDDALAALAGEKTTGDCSGTTVTFDICAEKSGAGGGLAYADIVNPRLVTGDSYEIRFIEEVRDGADARFVETPDLESLELPASRKVQLMANEASKTAATAFITYDVFNATTNVKVFDGVEAIDQTGNAAPQGRNVVVTDGISFSISGPPKQFLGIDQRGTAGGTDIIDSNLNLSLNAGGERGEGAVAWYADANGSGGSLSGVLSRIDWTGSVTENTPIEYEFRFPEDPLNNGQVVISGWTDGRGDGLGFLMKGWVEGVNGLFDDATHTVDAPLTEVIVENTTTPRLPLTMWELDPVAGTERQVVFSILDDDDDGYWDFNQAGSFDSPAYERIYATDITYDEAFLLSNPDDISTQDLMWDCFSACHTVGRFLFAMWQDDDTPDGGTDFYFAKPPAPGTVVRLTTSKPNLPGDVFAVNTDRFGATKGDASVAKAALDEIGIVPNPYLGASSYEVSQLTDEVRFTNLPDVATIRIFTLNGVLIRTLEKQSAGRADLAWDLSTTDQLPVASGVYLIHVEVPGLGERVLKFAVVKKRIQLNVF